MENTRLRLVFSTFPSCSQMTIVEDHGLPKIVMFGELSTGHRERGAPKKRFRDSLKKSLTTCNIDHRPGATQSTKLLPSLKWTGKIHSKTRDNGGRSAPPPPPHEICPGLNANEIQIPYVNHHKVSSLVKTHQNTHNSVKYEVI